MYGIQESHYVVVGYEIRVR